MTDFAFCHSSGVWHFAVHLSAKTSQQWAMTGPKQALGCDLTYAWMAAISSFRAALTVRNARQQAPGDEMH